MEDRLKYNLLSEVDKLTMPVLIIVGNKDKNTPIKHQQNLFDHLPGKKEMDVIKGAPHTFAPQSMLLKLKNFLTNGLPGHSIFPLFVLFTTFAMINKL